MKNFLHFGFVLGAMLLASVMPALSQSPAITGISVSAGVLTVTFSGGELETAPAVSGEWTGTGNTSGEFSESVVGGTNKFYRVRALALAISNILPETYTVQYNALAVDQLVYVTHAAVFTDVASLGGSTYIMTGNGNSDKQSTADPFLTFDVNTNVVVYVAHDDLINPKPTWMSTFSDTGENLATTTPSTLSLYAQEYPAGTVSLGGNGASIFSGNMYSVVITPGPAAAPTLASNPNPADTATDVSINAILSWTPGSKAFSHDVYFGTANPPPFQGNQTAITYSAGALSANTTYYWRIDEKNSQGTTTGTVWSFTTGEAAPLTISNVSQPGYTVQYDALEIGELIYVDRAITFTGVASLGGSTYIKTANDDKSNATEGFLTFDVNTNVVVYVGHDDTIATKPTWLSTFSDTGENLTGSNPATFSLYAQEFPTGTVSLGGNGAGVSGSMYSVVVTLGPTAAPTAASSPNPADSATGVSVNSTLSWTPGSMAFSRDLYFGTVNPPPLVGNQTATTYDPGTLTPNTTYYWRVDEMNSQGTTTGTVWSFTTGAAAPLTISNVSRPGYTVQYDSLTNGALIYNDRTFTFTNVASLGGSTYIKTANGDKSSTALNILSFEVNVNVVVYVAHDASIVTKPAWLTSSFLDTGENLKTSHGATYSLWAAEFPAGTVPLGPNGGGVSSSMYSVVITPAPASAPTAASNPTPADSATDIPSSTVLSWTAGTGAFSRDVYFGASNPPDYYTTQTATTFDTGALAPSTTFYWRVDEKNLAGTTTGTVWSFTTAP